MKSSRSAPASRTDAESFREIQRFQSETADIRYAPEPLRARLTLFLAAVFLLILVGITTVFKIDREVTSDGGKIVTVRPLIVLQALDASIIRSLDVREGDHVKANQVLARLDATFTAADVDALRLQVESLEAQIARATAELANEPFDYPATQEGRGNPYASAQAALFTQRKLQFDAQVKSNDETIEQAKGTLARLKTDMARYQERAAIASQVESMRSELNSLMVGSRINLLEATDTRLEILRNMEVDRSQITETEHQLAGSIYNRTAFIQQWAAQTSQELVTARNALDSARSQLIKADKHNDLVEVRAPEDAVALKFAKVSVGSVLKEGDPLVQLAVLNSPLEAEIHIPARDVGFVRPGDSAILKLDAFQYVEHGAATGKLLWISEGTFDIDEATGSNTDALGRPVPPYYLARVELTSVTLHNVPASFQLVPGMTLTADINVGTRSLFMYLVRGVIRGIDESMREPG